MSDRVILHCDLNNFFASVSLLSNQTIYDLPVAVCGSVEQRHGIVLAKNEIAKKYGVKTAETVREAKAKCPDLVILSPNYAQYEKYSKAARKIYERYTDMIEPFGIDECWLDVTGSRMLFGDGEQIANKIRREIKSELGITVSVGVSFNKVFAKLGSDMKKPDAVTVISREGFKEKIWGLPIESLLFAGKRTTDKLNSYGIFTIGDITLCDDLTLKRLLGKNGLELKKYALGLDDSPVLTPDSCSAPKSVGRTVTLSTDITSNEQVWKIYLSLAEDVAEVLKEKGLYAGGITVHTRTAALAVKETSRSFSGGVNSSISIAKRAMELFKEAYKWEMPLRSVGLRAINLKSDKAAVQQDIFGVSSEEEKQELIESSVDFVRKRFGSDSIKRASVIEGLDCSDKGDLP